MYIISAEIYDLVYSYKDYEKEASEIESMIKLKKPECKTILDIACGTGRHHCYLKEMFLVDGIDLNDEFLKRAKEVNPSGHYHVADMSDFTSTKKYDVIICLFSSIGYNITLEKLNSTLTCFYDCLNENGIIFIEPWFTPEVWEVGKLHMLTFDNENLKVCRMNQSDADGRVSITKFQYLVGKPDNGIKHYEERHELGLFTREEMLQSFINARFDIRYDEAGIAGRGMYIGTKKTTKGL